MAKLENTSLCEKHYLTVSSDFLNDCIYVYTYIIEKVRISR